MASSVKLVNCRDKLSAEQIDKLQEEGVPIENISLDPRCFHRQGVEVIERGSATEIRSARCANMIEEHWPFPDSALLKAVPYIPRTGMRERCDICKRTRLAKLPLKLRLELLKACGDKDGSVLFRAMFSNKNEEDTISLVSDLCHGLLLMGQERLEIDLLDVLSQLATYALPTLFHIAKEHRTFLTRSLLLGVIALPQFPGICEEYSIFSGLIVDGLTIVLSSSEQKSAALFFLLSRITDIPCLKRDNGAFVNAIDTFLTLALMQTSQEEDAKSISFVMEVLWLLASESTREGNLYGEIRFFHYIECLKQAKEFSPSRTDHLLAFAGQMVFKQKLSKLAAHVAANRLENAERRTTRIRELLANELGSNSGSEEELITPSPILSIPSIVSIDWLRQQILGPDIMLPSRSDSTPLGNVLNSAIQTWTGFRSSLENSSTLTFEETALSKISTMSGGESDEVQRGFPVPLYEQYEFKSVDIESTYVIRSSTYPVLVTCNTQETAMEPARLLYKGNEDLRQDTFVLSFMKYFQLFILEGIYEFQTHLSTLR